MESNKQERKNLVNDNPMAKRASEGSPAKNLNKGYGSEVKSPMAMMKSKKPSTAFAMKMSETRSALPMNMPDSPMKKALIGDQDKLPQALQDDIKAAPDSPAKMYETPLKKHKPGHTEPKSGTIENATDVTTTTDNVSGRQSNTSKGGNVSTSGNKRADGNIKVSQTFADGTSYGSTYSQKEINKHKDIPLKPQRDTNTKRGIVSTNKDGSTSFERYSQNRKKKENQQSRVRRDSVRTGNRNASTTAYNNVLNSFKTNN